MKRVALSVLVLVFGLFVVVSAVPQNATKEECQAKCQESAQMAIEKGVDAAVAEINKKDGKFVWKDSYVFLMDFDGKMLAHPTSPALVGQNVLDRTDKSEKGKLIFKEFVELAKSKGQGWVDYMWTKPGEQAPVKKVTYVYRIPGMNLLVAAGIYE